MRAPEVIPCAIRCCDCWLACSSRITAGLRKCNLQLTQAAGTCDRQVVEKFRRSPPQPEPNEALAFDGYAYVVLASSASTKVEWAPGFEYRNQITLHFYVLNDGKLVRVADSRLFADYDEADEFTGMDEVLCKQLCDKLPGARQR